MVFCCKVNGAEFQAQVGCFRMVTNAVQYFMKKDYFPNKALKAYTDIKKEKYYYKAAGNHNKHAQQTINMLTEKFEDC